MHKVIFRLYKPRQEWSYIYSGLYTGAMSKETTQEAIEKELAYWGNTALRTKDDEWYLEYTITINP